MEIEFKNLNEDARKLFDKLKIEKTNENAQIFGDFILAKTLEFRELVIDLIKTEFSP